MPGNATNHTDDFYERVYEIVGRIPKGRVTTYGAIAGYLGVASGARMVGYALNRSHSANIPAHRVLNRLGQLTGRAHFPDDTMRERLEQEGVSFVEEYTVDIEKHFWDPNELRTT
ncbi:MAG: MGMT family protein [Balneolaceae bacterium]|nr:MGMT family protein [Balneolaceae bacterium]